MIKRGESLQTFLARMKFNFFPCFRGTGAKVKYIQRDWRKVEVMLPLNWRTRNYVGTIFGGSLYAAVDPFYMLMLIQILGAEYVVWDKAASIRFLKPGRGALRATCLITGEEIAYIKEALREGGSIDRTYHVELVDGAGVVHARVEKVVYIRRA